MLHATYLETNALNTRVRIAKLAAPVLAATKSVAHIPSLDGLRAVSFILVFVAHAGLEKLIPGGFGVTIFFFLSGFLITTLMRLEYERKGSVSLRHFWLRRVLRIFPPFYLVLLTAIVSALVFEPAGTLAMPDVVAQLLHVSNYWTVYHGFDRQPAGTGVYWSLAVEEHFYLVFPWLYAGMRKLKMTANVQAASLWALCGAILAWRLVLVCAYHVPTDRTYMGTDTRMDSILFGCVLAVWHNPVIDQPIWRAARVKYCVLPLALAVLLLCLVIRVDSFRETLRYSLQGIALTGVFVCAIRFHEWLPFRFLNWRPLAFVGTLSYSLYLIHEIVIIAIQHTLTAVQPLAQAGVSLCVAIGFAWMMYRFIEMPCAQLRRRLSG